jgi:hypothetical protein
MPTPPTPATPLPTPVPQRSDPTNFRARADSFLTALPTYQTELDDIADNAYDNALEAETSATAAAVSASDAADSAAEAEGSATIAANASGAPLWVTGTTYDLYDAVLSPANQLTYRKTTATSVSSIDPSLDPDNWRLTSVTPAYAFVVLINQGGF